MLSTIWDGLSHARRVPYLDQFVDLLCSLKDLSFALIGQFEGDMSITPFDNNVLAPPTPTSAAKPKGDAAAASPFRCCYLLTRSSMLPWLVCALSDRPAAHLVDSSLADDSGVRSAMVCQYYQHRISVRVDRLQESPLAPTIAPLLPRLAAFRERVVPALTTDYKGRFVLSHMDLYPKNILVDESKSRTCGHPPLRWGLASPCDTRAR